MILRVYSYIGRVGFVCVCMYIFSSFSSLIRSFPHFSAGLFLFFVKFLSSIVVFYFRIQERSSNLEGKKWLLWLTMEGSQSDNPIGLAPDGGWQW